MIIFWRKHVYILITYRCGVYFIQMAYQNSFTINALEIHMEIFALHNPKSRLFVPVLFNGHGQKELLELSGGGSKEIIDISKRSFYRCDVDLS